MESLLSVSDVLLLPSELESFGLVALEAMASEVPVIATRVGGIPEVVSDGEDGYLFEVGDTEGMAEAAFSLLCDSGLRSKMGKSGREHAGRDFCHQKIVARYVELYEQMLGADG
jgi:glycosyltransferase involved in cell wall biosynthesis